ncbi:MAG: Flp pilus assembly complex ATPase component TadA [Candidatus Omnitrophica bacterium]|nr:Flp pilus assembly complex ATPase component TadA [Candidatus Omnitrophota bacterium]
MAERYELGQLLLMKGVITQEQLEEALIQQQKTKKFLGEILVEKGFVSKETLLECLTEQKRADYIKLSKVKGVKKEIVRLIPEAIARRYNLLAITFSEDTLVVAMQDPTDIVAIDTIKRITGKKIKVVKADEKEILERIERYYMETSDLTETIAALESDTEKMEEVDVNQLRIAAEDAPIVRFVNSMFLQAVEKRATDIHLEPGQNDISLRFRIDGILHEMQPPPKSAYPGIVTRLKIISSLDIGERRLPQDGRIRIVVGSRELDIRISTLPTIFGEKVVMRLLDKENVLLGLEQLGFEKQDLNLFQEALLKPYGMIIVTGPTGSGKTTTLYAGLSFINSPDINIVTIEDPVEYAIAGINQVQVKPKIGLTFPSVLRTLLRQDPDVIMVGEIRDLETAQIAVQASLTGHLVISTLHTNDTVSSITRLNYMGVEPYLLADSLNLILAQRLVRKICPSCKEEDPEAKEFLRKQEIMLDENIKLYKGRGCQDCDNTGYFGRVAIYELLNITKPIRRMIVERMPEENIREIAKQQGMVTLRDAAIKKVIAGITTIREAFSSTLAL